MGLCKCPKRRVTNQFCFEHRVNVCEHCMVTNHPKCIVQSYLQWLQDSDYNPICELCSRELADGDCVRLICYHVHHWACLDKFARQLPPTTAPAGYTCPSCDVGLFPAANLVSPVADVLREVLAGVNWARAGLGLPLLSDDREQKPSGESQHITAANSSGASVGNHVTEVSPLHTQPHVANQRQISPKRSLPNSIVKQSAPPPIEETTHSVVHMDDGMSTFSRNDIFPVAGQAPKRVFEALDDAKDMLFDHDENKYKRRSAMEWFTRWWKTISRPPARGHKGSGHLYKRYVMAAILVLVGLFTLVAVFSWLGRIATEGDPVFDEHQNPNVRVNDDSRT